MLYRECKHCGSYTNAGDKNCDVCGKEQSTPNWSLIVVIVSLLVLFALIYPSNVRASIDDEMYVLTEAIYFEARDQSLLGQTGVGCVIRSRVEKKNWPNTYRAVIWQRKQFSYTHDGLSERMVDRKAYYIARTIAQHVLTTDACNIFDGMDHYHNPKKSKAEWHLSMDLVMVVGDHDFYRRDEE